MKTVISTLESMITGRFGAANAAAEAALPHQRGHTGPGGAATESPAAVAGQVAELRRQLEAIESLSPSAQVDGLFEALVRVCCDTHAAVADVALPLVAEHAPALRRLSSAGEERLEYHWARRIATAADPHAVLSAFPYRDNYRQLVRMELGAVFARGRTPHRLAVLGCGALPMTGIELIAGHDVDVLSVDVDDGALAAADAVTDALGWRHRSASVCADVTDPNAAGALTAAGIGACDVVVLAAMVGESGSDKRAAGVLLSEVLAPDALVLVRSAAGLRSLLYPPVTVDDVWPLAVELELHPHTDVINSVLLARAQPAGAADLSSPG